MKRLVLVLLVFCAVFVFGSTPNPDDYPLTVHVVESQIVPYHQADLQRIVVTVDGKRYELLEPLPRRATQAGPLAIGDYKAKVTNEKSPSWGPRQTYELLMPDGVTRKFVLMGVFEH